MNDHYYEYRLGTSTRDTMRDLTTHEAHAFYVRGLCPFCGLPAPLFRRGPQGGFMTNIECPRCEARLNVLDPQRGIMFGFGQVIREPLPQEKPWWEKPASPGKTP